MLHLWGSPFAAITLVVWKGAAGLDNAQGPVYFGVQMARQVGDIKIVGTVEDLCFYKMEGAFFVRMKSSLTGKRFWKDKAFAGSRRSAGLLGRASSLASRLYHQLPNEKKDRDAFRQLTGKVKLLLKDGCMEEEIEGWFVQTYLPELVVVTPGYTKKKKVTQFTIAVRQDLRSTGLFLVPRRMNEQLASSVRPERRLRRLVRERGSPLRVVTVDGCG